MAPDQAVTVPPYARIEADEAALGESDGALVALVSAGLVVIEAVGMPVMPY
jgi:hypothetical protein